MTFIETILSGVFEIQPKVYGDDRGFFFESFNEKIFQEYTGHSLPFIQDNHSKSSYGVLRGLHLQLGKAAQSKLVRVIQGKVLDVVVDVRKESKTYGQHIAVELSDENKKQLFIPRGFAHGFVTLSDTAEFVYKCDNFYSPENESGILFSDENLDIDWKIDLTDAIISSKDLELKPLGEVDFYFN